MEKTFSKNNNWYAFYSKIAIFTVFKKIRNPTFWKKNSRSYEKSYHFSRTLRQICYNLVIKNFSQNRPDILPRQLASKLKKENVPVEWMIFPLYYKDGRK